MGQLAESSNGLIEAADQQLGTSPITSSDGQRCLARACYQS